MIRLGSLPVCFLPAHWLPTILGSDEWGPEERGRSQYIVGPEEEEPTTAVHWRDELEHWSIGVSIQWRMGTRLWSAKEEEQRPLESQDLAAEQW